MGWGDLCQSLRSRRHLLMILHHLFLPRVEVVLVVLQVQVVANDLRKLLLLLIELLLRDCFGTARNIFLMVVEGLNYIPVELFLVGLRYGLRFFHHLVLHFLNQLIIILLLAFLSAFFLLRHFLSLFSLLFHLPYLILAEPLLNPDIFSKLEDVGHEDPPLKPFLGPNSRLTDIFVQFQR